MSISTWTSWPRNSSMSPSQYTMYPCRVRPMTCVGFFTLRSSIRTSTVRSIIRARRCAACARFNLLMRCRRSCFTSSGTWLSQTAAGVFGLGEYAAVLTESKTTSSIRESVSWNCSSVSPGNPTMTSAVMEASGILCKCQVQNDMSPQPSSRTDIGEQPLTVRMRSTMCKYFSRVWPRPIATRSSLDPLWNGM